MSMWVARGMSSMSCGSVFWSSCRYAGPFKRWNDDRSQQIIPKNSTPDVYGKFRLVNSDEHCVRIVLVPYVAVSAVEVAITCEARLIGKQDMCRKGRIIDVPLQKPPGKSHTGCEVIWPKSLYFL